MTSNRNPPDFNGIIAGLARAITPVMPNRKRIHPWFTRVIAATLIFSATPAFPFSWTDLRTSADSSSVQDLMTLCFGVHESTKFLNGHPTSTPEERAWFGYSLAFAGLALSAIAPNPVTPSMVGVGAAAASLALVGPDGPNRDLIDRNLESLSTYRRTIEVFGRVETQEILQHCDAQNKLGLGQKEVVEQLLFKAVSKIAQDKKLCMERYTNPFTPFGQECRRMSEIYASARSILQNELAGAEQKGIAIAQDRGARMIRYLVTDPTAPESGENVLALPVD